MAGVLGVWHLKRIQPCPPRFSAIHMYMPECLALANFVGSSLHLTSVDIKEESPGDHIQQDPAKG